MFSVITDGGVDIGARKCQKGLRHTEDKLWDVESTQDILGHDLPILDERKCFFGGGGSIVIVHRGGRNLKTIERMDRCFLHRLIFNTKE